jgi:hypothetical protein
MHNVMTTDVQRGTGEATLLFGGDTVPIRRGADAVRLGPDIFWPEITTLFKEHDVAVLNLESPLVSTTTAPPLKCGPVLAASPRFADFLAESGVTVVTLANNHIMDAGSAGLEATRTALRQAGVVCTGAGHALATAQEPLLLPTPAGTIGVISVAEGEFSAASPRSGGAAPLDEMTIVAQLGALSANCSLTIVVYHGGNEGYDLPSPDMARRCRAFVDAGAAAVVCHHAHATSGCEVYKGAPIAYGLGNLMFDLPQPPYASWNIGALLSLRVRSGRVTHWRLLGTEQDMAVPVVRLAKDRSWFERETAKKSAIISSPVDLAREFERFCHSSRELYLTRLLGLNRVERRLFRWGIHPRWRFRRPALVGILNVLECESHREAAAEVLRQEIGFSAEYRPDASSD